MPKQLCTTVPVMASESTLLRALANKMKYTAATGREDKYSDLVLSTSQRKSMENNPARHFLMAEQDKRGEACGAGQSGASKTSGEQNKQDETSGAVQHAGDAFSQTLISFGAYDTVDIWLLKQYSSVQIVFRTALKER